MRANFCLLACFTFIFSFAAHGQAPPAKGVVSAPAETPAPAPTPTLTPEQELAKIDDFLLKFNSLSKDPAEQKKYAGDKKISEVVSSRLNFCHRALKSCLDLSKMKPLLCANTVDTQISVSALWSQLFMALKKDDKSTAAFARNIANCEPGVTQGELLGLAAFLNESRAGRMVETMGVLANSMRKDFATPPLNLTAAIDTALDVQTSFAQSKPIYVLPLKESIRMMLSWLSKTDPALVPAAYAEKVVIAANFTLQNFGEGRQTVEFIKQNPAYKKMLTPRIAAELTNAQCNYWRESNQVNLCAAEIAATRKQLGATFNLPLDMEAARNAFVVGKYDEAIEKMTVVRNQAIKNNAKDLLPWVNSILAIFETHANKLTEAQAHLDQYEKAFNTVTHNAWYSFYIPSLKAIIMMQNKNYDGALQGFTKLRSDILATVDGPIDTLAWTELHLMMVCALRGDKKAVAENHVRLKNTVAGLPSYAFLGKIGDAVAKAAAGTYTAADMEPARKLVGAKYPDVQRHEQLIARLKK